MRVASLAMGANSKLAALTREGQLLELNAHGMESDTFPPIKLPEGTREFAVSYKGSVAFTSTEHPDQIGYLDFKDRQEGNVQNIVWLPLPRELATGNPDAIRSMIFSHDGKLVVQDHHNTLWEGTRQSFFGTVAMQWKDMPGLAMKPMPRAPAKLTKPHPEQLMSELKKSVLLNNNGQLVERKANGQPSYRFPPIQMPKEIRDFAVSLDGSVAIVSDDPQHRGQVGFLSHEDRANGNQEAIRWIPLHPSLTSETGRRIIENINFSLSGGFELTDHHGVKWKSSTPNSNSDTVTWQSMASLPATCYEFAVSAGGAVVHVTTDAPETMTYTPPLEDGSRSDLSTLSINLPEVFRKPDGRNIGFMSFTKDGMLILHDTAGRRWRSTLESTRDNAPGKHEVKWQALQAEAATTRPHVKVPGLLPPGLAPTLTKANPQLPVVPPVPEPQRLILRVNGEIGGLDEHNHVMVLGLDGRWSYADQTTPNALRKFFKGYKERPAGGVNVSGLGLFHGTQNWMVGRRKTALDVVTPPFALKNHPTESRPERWKQWFKGIFEHPGRVSTVHVEKDLALARQTLLAYIAQPQPDLPIKPAEAQRYINDRIHSLLTQLSELTGTVLDDHRSSQAIVTEALERLAEHDRTLEAARKDVDAHDDDSARAPQSNEAQEQEKQRSRQEERIKKRIKKSIKNTIRNNKKHDRAILRNYRADPQTVRSNKNLLYVLQQAREAMGNAGDQVSQILDSMLAENKFLAFDSSRHLMTGHAGHELNISLHKNRLANITSELLLLHALMVTADGNAGQGTANANNAYGLVLMPDETPGREDARRTDAAEYKLVKMQTLDIGENLNLDAIPVIQNAPGTMADTAVLLKTFNDNTIPDIRRLLAHQDAWDFFRAALSANKPSARVVRLLSGESTLGVQPSAHGLAATYGVRDPREAYQHFFSLMPYGASLKLELAKVAGFDLEGASLFFKTHGFDIAKLGYLTAFAQLFAIEPISALSYTTSHSMLISATRDSYSIAVANSSQVTQNMLSAKIQLGAGGSASLTPKADPDAAPDAAPAPAPAPAPDPVAVLLATLIAFLYAGLNFKFKALGYTRDITSELRFTIPKDDIGRAEAILNDVLRGKLSLSEMVALVTGEMISKRTKTDTFTFNFDIEPLLASGLVIPKAIGDGKNFLWKYIFAPMVLQVNYAAKRVAGMTSAIGGDKITLTFHDSTDQELFATYIGVHEFQTNAGQHDPDGPNGPVKDFDPQQKSWLPFLGIIHLQKKILGKALQQDGFSATYNTKTHQVEAVGFTISANPPAASVGKSAGIQALRDQYLDTNEDVSEEMIPALGALLKQHPELKESLRKLKASKNPVNVSLELKPNILAKINEVIRVLDGKKAYYYLEEIISSFLLIPNAVRITSLSVTATHKNETGTSSGVSALRYQGKGTLTYSEPSASINIHYSDEDGSSRVALGGSLVEDHKNTGVDQIERILREGGDELWTFLQNPIGKSQRRAKYAREINNALIALRKTTTLLDDQHLQRLRELEQFRDVLSDTKARGNSVIRDQIVSNVDKILSELSLNWDALDNNESFSKFKPALSAFFSTKDGRLDQARLLQILNDEAMLVTFMASICRSTRMDMPELHEKKALDAAAVSGAEEAAPDKSTRRGTFSRWLGLGSREKERVAGRSGKTELDAATGTRIAESRVSPSLQTQETSPVGSRTEVSVVGAALPGLSATPGIQITAPSGHLVPPTPSMRGSVRAESSHPTLGTESADAASRRASSTGRLSLGSRVRVLPDPRRLDSSRVVSQRRAGLPDPTRSRRGGLAPVAEWRSGTKLAVTHSSYEGWPSKGEVFHDDQHIVRSFRDYLEKRLTTDETLNPEKNEGLREVFEGLRAITDDELMLKIAGAGNAIQIREVRAFVDLNDERLEEPNARLLKGLEAIKADDPMPRGGLYDIVSTALGIDNPQRLRGLVVDWLQRHPERGSELAYYFSEHDSTEDFRGDMLMPAIDRLIAAVADPSSVPLAERNRPNSTSAPNLGGIILDLIATATNSMIFLKDAEGGRVPYFLPLEVDSSERVNGGESASSDQRTVYLQVANGNYHLIDDSDDETGQDVFGEGFARNTDSPEAQESLRTEDLEAAARRRLKRALTDYDEERPAPPSRPVSTRTDYDEERPAPPSRPVSTRTDYEEERPAPRATDATRTVQPQWATEG